MNKSKGKVKKAEAKKKLEEARKNFCEYIRTEMVLLGGINYITTRFTRKETIRQRMKKTVMKMW